MVLLLFCLGGAYAVGLFLMCSNISSSRLFCLCICFVAWYCMYVPAVTDVGLMCHLLHVILLPFVVSCIVYEQLLWL